MHYGRGSNNTSCVWADEEAETSLQLVHEKNINATLDGKQQQNSATCQEILPYLCLFLLQLYPCVQ